MRNLKLIICICMLVLIPSCSQKDDVVETPATNTKTNIDNKKDNEPSNKAIDENIETNDELDHIDKDITHDDSLIKNIKNKYGDITPTAWGENIEGVITSLDTDQQIVALTFDACGGEHGSKYDSKLIDLLIKEEVPSTLFINSRWIDENKRVFKKLSKNPLFEIENHGHMHKPLSVNGKTVYNIKGTENVDEVIDEIHLNKTKIHELAKIETKYFRSGTAYYDDVAVNIAIDLGQTPVNFDIIGDGGAKFSKEQVKEATLKAQNGSIIIYHMNQPDSETMEGLKEAIPLLKEKGFTFVKLEDYIKED